MKLGFCAVCGTTNDLHQHHIDPIVYTGLNRKRIKKYDGNKALKDCNSFEIFAYLFDMGIISEDETITVCSYHHNILHGIVKFQKYDSSKLIREGIKRAREKGVKLGRPSKVNSKIIQQVVTMRKNNMSIQKIAKGLGIGVGTTSKILAGEGMK